MTKTTLLTATAFAALALAGAANAQVITAGTVNNQVVAAGNFAAQTGTPYLIASEMKTTIPANLSTNTALATGTTSTIGTGLDVVATGTNVTTFRLTVTLSGSATPTFQTALAGTSLTLGGAGGSAVVTALAGLNNDATCNYTAPTLVSGGAIGGTTAVFEFAADSGCEATGVNSSPTTFAVAHQLSIATNGNVSVTHGLARSAGEAITLDATILGATALRSKTVVDSVTGYAFTITPDATDTFLQLETSGAQFRTISGGNAIGAVNLRPAAGVSANLFGDAIPTTDYRVTLVSLDGVFSATAGLTPSIAPGCNPTGTVSTAFTITGNTATTNTCIQSATNRVISITAAPATGNTATLANRNQRYSVTITPDSLDGTAARVNQPAAQSGLLETIEIAGQRITAPWVTDTTRGFNTVLRLANTAGNAIGAIQLQLSSPAVASANATRVCDASTVAGATGTARLAGIAAGSVVVVDSALLEQCFGQFRNGDLSVTVLDNANNVAGLSAKLRLVDSTGSVTEQSLGRSSGTATLQ